MKGDEKKMAYCGIYRVEKRKRGAVYGLQIEANRDEEDKKQGRDFERSDIDWEKTKENIYLAKTKNWNKEITKQIHEAGVKEKSNSVVMLDGVYTASPEFFVGKTKEEIIDYFQDCLKFHIDKYCLGDEKRVINAVIHFDETTPHMQVASVPIYENETGLHLSAREICGNRNDYRKKQDLFFEEVTEKYGLERGNLVEYVPINGTENDKEKIILSRSENSKLHTTKREWQIKNQEIEIEQNRQENEKIKRRNEEEKAELQKMKNAVEETKKENDEYKMDSEFYKRKVEQCVAIFEKVKKKMEDLKDKKKGIFKNPKIPLEPNEIESLLILSEYGATYKGNMKIIEDMKNRKMNEADKDIKKAWAEIEKARQEIKEDRERIKSVDDVLERSESMQLMYKTHGDVLEDMLEYLRYAYNDNYIENDVIEMYQEDRENRGLNKIDFGEYFGNYTKDEPTDNGKKDVGEYLDF